MNRIRRIHAFHALALAAVLSAAGCASGRRAGRIPVSGEIEATSVQVSFKIAGVVRSRAAAEGEPVAAGQAVAELDDAELRHEVELRRADLRAVRAALADLEAGARPEEIARAEAAERQARSRVAELEAGARKQEVEQAEAAAKGAQARLDEALAGARPQEIAVAEATVKAAEAEAGRLQAEVRRLSALRDGGGAVTERDLDAARAALAAVEARLDEGRQRLAMVREGPRKEAIDQARALLDQARAALALVRAGPRKEQIEQAKEAQAQAKAALDLLAAGARKDALEQARARADQADQALALAETRLGFARIVSPLAGTVLSCPVEAGEVVAPGTPVAVVGDLSRVWLRAYVEETDLGRVKTGQKVLVTIDTFPGKTYEGRVAFLSPEAEFTPRNVQTRKERVRLVYRVKVEIPNPDRELKPGMPAEGEIVTE
jgi:HlyD family secretion protein